MKGNGFAFSFDLFISFLVMCFMLYLILLNLDLMVQNNVDAEREWLLQGKGIYLLDSMVKNSDENNALLGAAYYNPEKRRIESNIIDYGLLKTAFPGNVSLGGKTALKSISLEYLSGERETIYSKKVSGDCMAFERYVLVKKLLNEKAKLGVVLCHEP